MKYLKSYKLFELQISGFEESDIKSVFEPYINWNLVRDVEEMSLEYIDNDMILNLEITYDKKYYIYFMRYDHSGSNGGWMIGSFNSLTEGPYELEPIDKSKMVYQFYLTKDEMIQKEADNELESRIKEAYPDENINPRLSFADYADEMIHDLFVGESFTSDFIQLGTSVLSILSLISIPFIPMFLQDIKDKKERRIKELAIKDKKLNNILLKIGSSQRSKDLLLQYKYDIESGNLSEKDKSEYILKLSNILTSDELIYCDEIIKRL